MKSAVFLDVWQCESCYNRNFVGNIASIFKVERISELVVVLSNVLQLLVTANAVTS
jgi:hypothetical protein